MPCRLWGVLLVLSVLATTCASESTTTETDIAITTADDQDFGDVFSGPLVELPEDVAPSPGQGNAAPKFANGANPTTLLGAVRARHLPVWSSELEWAFPPYVCQSAWELDAIADPDPDADVRLLGDFMTAAVLTVMRYEFQLSRALHQPSELAQLCVAVASVGQARSDSLEVLRTYLDSGSQRTEAPRFPEEVLIVAISPSRVLAVACVDSSSPDASDTPDAVEEIEPDNESAQLQAYLLSVSKGIEDAVVDISYRVSDATHEKAQDCEELDTWADLWYGHAQNWISQGRVWQIVGTAMTATQICRTPPPEGPKECPNDWLS